MQDKKPLLQRLLLIYITFFVVLAASLLHGALPDFSRGYREGNAVGQDIVRSYLSGTPRQIYLLDDIPVKDEEPFDIADGENTTVEARVTKLALTVSRNAPNASIAGIAFSSVGGSPWFYIASLTEVLCRAAIIVLMILIIRSLRRSIRRERPLDRRNVALLRTIGALTIVSELLRGFVDWRLTVQASELLAGSGCNVDTTIHVTYTTLIMGILVLFAAEVFAIGQSLSEEQKLTI